MPRDGPRRKLSSWVFDSSALIAVINSEPGRERVAEALVDGGFLSTVNLAEVVSWLDERGFTLPEIEPALSGFELDTVPFDDALALDAGRLRAATKSLGLSLGDRACLALAKALELPAITGEQRWARLDVGVQVELFR